MHVNACININAKKPQPADRKCCYLPVNAKAFSSDGHGGGVWCGTDHIALRLPLGQHKYILDIDDKSLRDNLMGKEQENDQEVSRRRSYEGKIMVRIYVCNCTTDEKHFEMTGKKRQTLNKFFKQFLKKKLVCLLM